MARTRGQGNPRWTRDEVILALDLYFGCEGHIPPRSDPRVQELSRLLLRQPSPGTGTRNESFRDPDGVLFKLQNLRKVATGKGLGNVSQTDHMVWDEFGDNPNGVRELANLIQNAMIQSEITPGQAEENDEEVFFEGRAATRLHKVRERNPQIRKRLLASRRKSGRLKCDICDGHSRVLDPTLEDATFEGHHRVPFALAGERAISVAEMALLCANCHRLLHRAISREKRWLDIDEARTVLSSPQGVGSQL